MPLQNDAAQVIEYVGDLARCVVDKERAIRLRSSQTFGAVEAELRSRSTAPPTHSMPTLTDIQQFGRFDAAIYDREYKQAVQLVDSYEHWRDPVGSVRCL
jgi:hypothetical protein